MFIPGRRSLSVFVSCLLAGSLLACNLLGYSITVDEPTEIPAAVSQQEEIEVVETPQAQTEAEETPSDAPAESIAEPEETAKGHVVDVPMQVEISFDTFAPSPLGPEAAQFPAGISPLTGLPVRDATLLDIPAVHASITNTPVSTRPQAGLSDAAHTFEIYIGNGMSRFLAVFHGEVPTEEPLMKGDFEARQELFVRSGLILGNQVWFDEDNNGINDPNEYGISGVGISLFDGETRRLMESTTTDSNGFYAFNIFPGRRYFLQFFLPPEYAFSAPDSGVDDFVDSDADPLSGLTPTFTAFFDDLRWDAGMSPKVAIRHLPETAVMAPETDYKAAGEDFLARIEAEDVDASKVYEYENLYAILSGLARQASGGAFTPPDTENFDFPMPVGEHETLMGKLTAAWKKLVKEQAPAIEERSQVLIERLQEGNLNLLHEARILMILLGGTEAVDLAGENGPFRILPDGAHAGLMQEMIDAAREGAEQEALAVSERLRQGDWVAFGDAVQLTMFLREKRFLNQGELSGMLGITPLGENAQNMSALLYAAREGANVLVEEVIERLNTGEEGALYEAEKLMLVLAEKTDPTLDEDQLPLPEGPNANAMEKLGDAIRSARAFPPADGATSILLPDSSSTQQRPPGLMSPAQQDDPPPQGLCDVEVGMLPVEAVLHTSPDGLLHIALPPGLEATDWQSFAQEYPDAVGVSGGPYGVTYKFQSGTTFLQNDEGVYRLTFPGCGDESQQPPADAPATTIDLGGECLREVTLFADTTVSAAEDGTITFQFAQEDSVELVGQDPGKLVASSSSEAGRTIELPTTPETAISERPDGGHDVSFPSGMQLALNENQTLSVRMPGCDSGKDLPFFEKQFINIGPTSSALVSQEQFLRLYTNSCLVYEGKASGVTINGCAVAVGGQGESITTGGSVGLDPLNLRGIAENSALEGSEKPNYSGNTFNPVPPAGGQTADQILFFYGQLNQSLWRYDPVSQTYLRYEDLADGSGVFIPALDKLTGRQTSAANVILVYTQYEIFQNTIRKVPLTGNKGKGVLFRNGKMYPILWNTKAQSYERTTERMRPIKIVDEDDNPFPLQPGQSWFYVTTSTSVYWELEDEPGKWKVRSYAPPGM
jgi:hypothetical protein